MIKNKLVITVKIIKKQKIKTKNIKSYEKIDAIEDKI